MITSLDIASLIHTLAGAKKWEPTYCSRLVAGSGDTITRLESGRSITLDRAAHIIRRCSELWPQDLEWPQNIPQPLEVEK